MPGRGFLTFYTLKMKRKFLIILAWILVFALGAGVVVDIMLVFGLPKCWQYLYNAAYFFFALPLTIFLIADIKFKQR